jgi:hypothetical protein
MSTPKFSDIIAAHKQRKDEGPEQQDAPAEVPASPEPAPPPAKAKPARQTKPTPPSVEQPRKVGRPAVGKRGNPDYTQVSVLLNKARYTQARIALLQAGGAKDMSDLVDELLSNWLKKNT